MNHVFSISKSRNFSDISQSKIDNLEVSTPYLVSPSNTSYGGATNSDGSIVQGATQNVVQDFYWTYSKTGDIARAEVPRIILQEKRLKVNTLISQLKYSFGATATGISGGLRDLSNQAAALSFLNATADQADTLSNKVNEKIAEFSSRVVDNNSIYNRKNNYLKPYQNLYITEDTGWNFILPYFDNYNNAQQNIFSGDANTPYSGLVKVGADFLSDISSFISTLRNPADITFVEKAKLYNYPMEGEEFSFSFPLINTGSASFEDVIRNWELLFLLLYNNKPSRRSVSVIDPPVLYQVTIPGVKFLPFCYISNIAVEFQGSRRELSFGLPIIDNLNVLTEVRQGTTGRRLSPDEIGPNQPESTSVIRDFTNSEVTRNIKTIVPDAYLIKITLKSLLTETKNFMYELINDNPVVSTSVLTPNTFLQGLIPQQTNANSNTPFRPADVNTR
jgi:hypothetical protein